nr:3'(2'),5'-bisphosphate nucleotidase CysQ [uncultured Methylotenera sp.]
MMYDGHPFQAEVVAIAKEAGDAIMRIYSTDFGFEMKSDNSPLTQADIAAHDIIVTKLRQLTPHIPVLSEESTESDIDSRLSWQTYWLIDPLDGTREFLKRNGEFTVNIALIDQHQSVMGVVYAPVTGLVYYASRGHGAYKQEADAPAQRIHVKPLNLEQITIAGSRSHSDERFQKFLHGVEAATMVKPELICLGSSLKICLVAEGKADVYPRLGPTYEWDTAAGHCVLQEAGGDIVDMHAVALSYNAKLSLLNPHFFATAEKSQQWAVFL